MRLEIGDLEGAGALGTRLFESLAGAGEANGALDDRGAVKAIAQLARIDVLGGVRIALVDLLADDAVAVRGGGVITLWGPDHPLAVRSVEQAGDQLAG